MKLPISVFIITLNEEHNIRRLLESLKPFQEIIVVDSGSTDKTLQIAKEYNAKVTYNPWPGYAKQKQFAMNLCSNDWVLNLDADEEIPKNLLTEIEQITSQEDIDAVRFARCDLFLGKKMHRYCSLFSNTRLYRKSKASFDLSFLVHESATIKGKQAYIKTPFLHYGYNDIDTLCSKLNDYSTLKAKEKFTKGKTANLAKLLLIFPIEFIRKLIFQRFALFGVRGFILSILYAHYALLKEAKLYSLQASNTP
jgi:glycosyltransferase involved in cell wall biosynthesis